MQPAREESGRADASHPDELETDLVEVSQQIHQLSRQVENLARRGAQRRNPETHVRPDVSAFDRNPVGNRRGAVRRHKRTAFCDEIAMERAVGEDKIPISLPRYNGSTDPWEHLQMYETLMEVHGHSSNMYAKLLATTFQGVALNWFTNLEP